MEEWKLLISEKKMIGVIFMDLKRAFETVDRERLLAKLYLGLEIKHWNDLVLRVETITADRYQRQLANLSDALKVKRLFTGRQERRKVILLHDNIRPHVAKATQHLFASGWELLPHAAYSPNMAPSDYYLFRSLQHVADTHFMRFEEIRKCIDDFIASKPVIARNPI